MTRLFAGRRRAVAKRQVLSALGLAWLISAAAAASPDPARPIAIIPKPVSVAAQTGFFTLSANTIIQTDSATAELGRGLAAYLEPATGFRLRVQAQAATTSSRISLALDPRLERLGPEGYTLDVGPHRVVARAFKPAGIFYAMQSLRQLLPPEIFREARVAGVAWTMPAVRIEDKPRFSWRGMHLDVGRHFMPREFVKKYIDLLALHKMNTFHWHLTDDQGWRIEIRKYPKLTEVGAWRKQTVTGHQPDRMEDAKYDGVPHGGFYTQDDIREVVAYAAARYITIVPEIEMPGHAQAAIAAYPELGVDGAPTEVGTWWGVYDNILNPTDNTVRFMQDVLTEVMDLFPGRFIHVGGDEAEKTRWKASPVVQARIKQLGLADEEELQSWFIRQMDSFIASKGRRLIGWDEILQGGLAPGATVMSWRGVKGGVTAAQQGHDVVMAPTSHTYFDYYQAKPEDREPLAIGGYVPIDKVYSFDPVPPDLGADFAKHVLGAQGQLWTEYIQTPRQLEYMAFPRACALAEVVWTPPAAKDFADFVRRLDVHARRLAILDVNAAVTPAQLSTR
ncbi:MAG: beta-N-acetylhexosaminidase [Bacteroidales bacterium]